MLPDIAILCVVGTVPDYIQGVIKLVWAVSVKNNRNLVQMEGTAQ
jgi:hypothetical protein